MSSDFAEAGKRLEAAIPVPEFSIASIRKRAQMETAQHRVRALAACVLGAVIVLGSGTILAAMNDGVRLWLSGNKAAVVMRSFTSIPPAASDLRRLSSNATFPVVFPADIPKAMRLAMILVSPADHPDFIYVQYRNDSGSSWGFSLFESSTVNAGAIPALPNGEKLLFKPVARWTVGRETVITSDPGVESRAAAVKDAMLRLTPAQSLADTLLHLDRIHVLGGLESVAAEAEAIAPAEGRSVLVDRGNLGQIATLAREHKALFAIRTVTVDNLPMVDGKPDFAHQSSHFTKALAISAGGVRALATILASNVCGSAGRMGSGFSCEMLINERSGRAYRIWVLPLKSSASPTKFTVDSSTFRVIHGS